MTAHLVILGDRDALRWVLENERMAFEDRRAGAAARIKVGDTLFLYTTRGCFRNPTRDRGRIIGRARATSAATRLRRPVAVMGRTFPIGCNFELLELAPRHEGVVLADLVAELAVFPNTSTWSARMRRPLLSLPDDDPQLIERELTELTRPPVEVLATYM